jgi:hypothetical protein
MTKGGTMTKAIVLALLLCGALTVGCNTTPTAPKSIYDDPALQAAIEEDRRQGELYKVTRDSIGTFQGESAALEYEICYRDGYYLRWKLTTPDNLKDVQLELLHDGHESARRKAGCDAIIQKQNTLWHKHYLEEKRKDDAYDRAHKGKGKSGDRRDVP